MNEETITVEITDTKHLAKVIHAWHTAGVDMVRHLHKIPEGIELVDEEGNPLVLVGDVHKAFRAGIASALSQFSELPFSIEFEKQPEETKAEEVEPA